ncbi:MAG: glycoside hydrolase [Verrucomicrobia bacterium]|nr:MAG: glycoside hydrolase [Verrucomicrobiota bacterium]
MGKAQGRAASPGPCARTQSQTTSKKLEMQMKPQLFEGKNLTDVNRMTQFAFQAPTARQVTLAGEFNNWDINAEPMHKDPDGVWRLSVALKPGRYEYRFLADGVWCDDPAAQQKAANSVGTENCVRFV